MCDLKGKLKRSRKAWEARARGRRRRVWPKVANGRGGSRTRKVETELIGSDRPKLSKKTQTVQVKSPEHK
eukprot:1815532-Pleurochrysis_carterae.AAC.8